MRAQSVILLLATCASVTLSAVISRDKVEADANVMLKSDASLAAQGNGFSNAFDFVGAGTQTTFTCLHNSNFNLAMLRIYNSGQGDPYGAQNVFYANNAGLLYEVFVTPLTNGGKTGASQFTEAYNFANSQGLRLNRMWLQVTNPIMWGTNINSNIQLIKSFINTANNNGVGVGLYTNWYDWQQITGSTNTIIPYAIWYWNQNGVSVQGETKRDASDFVPFGGFSSAMIKQYGNNEPYCLVTVGANIYASSSSFQPNTVDMSMFKQAN